MDRVDQVLQKAQARLSVPQGGSVPPPMSLNQGAKGLLDYVGQNQQAPYVPFAPGTPTLSGKQFALSEANTTGYYAPAEMKSMLDQIQQNKNINMNTQDDAQRQQAQAQNHALYGQLQSRYGIDGESIFNTADNKQNALNMASAYRGQPTMAKKAQDFQQEYQKNSQELANKQFGLSKDQFDFSKDKYNESQQKDAYTNRFMQEIMGGNFTSEADAYQALADYTKDPGNADKPLNTSAIFEMIQKRFPKAKPQSATKQIPIPSYDPDKWKNEQEYWDFVGKLQGK
jgi:hypothetical protein